MLNDYLQWAALIGLLLLRVADGHRLKRAEDQLKALHDGISVLFASDRANTSAVQHLFQSHLDSLATTRDMARAVQEMLKDLREGGAV